MSDKKEIPEHVGVLLGSDESGREQVIYERDGQVNIGTLNPIEEGKEIQGELVEVRKDGPIAYMKNHGRMGRATTQGPAMVNDRSYKEGWDRMFGNKKKSNKDLN